MDLRIPWKVLSKEGASSSARGAFPSKRIAFLVIAGLALVVGIVLRSSHYFTRSEVEQNASVEVAPSPPPAATTTESIPPPTSPPPGPASSSVGSTDSVSQSSASGPNEQKEQTGEGIKEPEQAEEAAEDSEQPELPGSGMILVSRQPIGLLASPSPSASVLYGFPAGRPFRVIGRDGGFAHIKDLQSNANGWIDETSLAPSGPIGSPPPQPKPYSVSRIPPRDSWAGSKPKATKNNSTATAESEAATPPVRKRPGLFGGGGLFGGIFGNGN
jgi:hypothetical protein